MKDVRGPHDVAPGDLVVHDDHDSYRAKRTICVVRKATAARLTVEFPDGTIKPIAYTRQVKCARGLTQHVTFQRLDAWARWRHEEPKGDAHVVFNNDGPVSVVLSIAFVRRPDGAAIAALTAVTAWLGCEPKKGAP